MNCDELSDLYELYALGVLEDDERAELDSHLSRGCATCQAELRRAIGRNAVFAKLAEDVAPPARMRRRVLAGAGLEQPRGIWMGIWALVTACLLIAALYFGTVNREQRERAASERREWNQAISMLAEPDTRHVDFNKGRVYVNQLRGVLLVASGMSAAPSGKTYEFWLIPKGGAPIPAGLFNAGPNGDAMHYRGGAVDPNLGAVAVSIEPPEGSRAPTTKPILVVAL